MICECCNKEIQDGEEYAYIDVLDVILHEDCINKYIDKIAIHKIRDIAEENWAYREDHIDMEV